MEPGLDHFFCWDGLDRSMDLRVSRLRARLQSAGALIRSVRGQGYMLATPVLVQVGYGEREGQRPRYLDIQKPLGTST